MRVLWSVLPVALALGGCVTTNPQGTSSGAPTVAAPQSVVPPGTEDAYRVLKAYADTSNRPLDNCAYYRRWKDDALNRATGNLNTGMYAQAWAGYRSVAQWVAACAIRDKSPTISTSDAYDLAGGYVGLAALAKAKEGMNFPSDIDRKTADDAILLLSVNKTKNEQMINQIKATGLATGTKPRSDGKKPK